MSGDDVRLARRLRDAREAAGLSQHELDDLVGWPRGTTEAYELTQRSFTVTTLHDVARALGVTASDLLRDE